MSDQQELPNKDQLFRFLFEQTNIRGELVHLDDSWQAVLQRYDYPAPVRDLLGQTMAAAALLASTLKRNSNLIIQIQGTGPISLLVVQVDNRSRLRGMAEWEGDLSAGTLGDLFGKGHLAITIDPRDGKERYQSIIDLGTETLSQALDNYFKQSEQLNTRLWLSANEFCAAGLLLQELPENNNIPFQDDDTWNRVTQLSDTITAKELHQLSVMTILKRLYHEEDVRVFEPEQLFFHCSCSRENISNTLRGLGREEIQSILEDEGQVKVECHFCKKSYLYDRVDSEALFASDTTHSLINTKH